MKSYRLKSDDASIAKAAQCLGQGGLVAFPTETVYGIGVDATDKEAVLSLYRAKERPSHNPLIIHIAHPEEAALYGELNDTIRRAMMHFWQKEKSSITFIIPFKKKSAICSQAIAHKSTIALRLPHHRVAQSLLMAAGVPIAAPSANISGNLSASSADAAWQQLEGRIHMLIEDEQPLTRLGIESTILDLTGDVPLRLRTGAVKDEILHRYFGTIDLYEEQEKSVHSPGLMGRHYAPSCCLRLNARSCQPHEVGLSFGRTIMTGGRREMNLSQAGNMDEAAHNFYEMLRLLDDGPDGRIAIAPIPMTGIGHAINDRLHRATAGMIDDNR